MLIALLPVKIHPQLLAASKLSTSKLFPVVLHKKTTYLTRQSVFSIIKAIAQGNGPDKSLLALGYTGWISGQLEQEIMDNSWLSIDPSTSLIFDMPIDEKWRGSMASIGVDPAILSMESGHA